MAKIVLVADDDPKIRRLLCDVFEREDDYDLCEQAKDGKEAVELAARCKPDLIILDFSMPVMSGIQAAKLIKAQMPEIPIILFTMHDRGIFGEVNPFVAPIIDRIVQKTEMAHLMHHVRELAPV
jgi:DNA-binding NarL/FixJ family response regulator